ncbi:MAG: hypothetical protein KIT10_13770 [Flavobacteriales bacterium]|nr:hypothetical protein [Flavobacteriales bacterium]
MRWMDARIPWGLFLLASFPCAPALAQNEEDALRISGIRPLGTARSAGMANAFGALGADPASISINPAGFGLYRTSELSITPAMEVNDAANDFYGTRAADTESRFNLGNVALVLNNPSDRDSDWRSGTFGVVYDRQATHNWRRLVEGRDVPSTILQGFVYEAEGTQDSDLFTFFPFTAGLAWDTYAIDPLDSAGTSYVSLIPFGSPTDQIHTIESRGRSNTTSFFYSGNYLDALYVGVSVGIAGHRFQRTTTHTETTRDGSLDLAEVRYREDLTITGSGFDVKLGIIGRITERFRMGLAWHSPQWMQLNDGYNTSMRTRFRTPDANGAFEYFASSPDGLFSYRVNTPWRGILSAAYVAGAHALFSVDYEYTDFRRMRMRASSRILDDYDFAFENSVIERVFRPAHALRVGTEWRLGHWYYRLGWSISADPYVDADARQGQALKVYAGGLGYRGDHLGIDLGLNYAQRGVEHFIYDPWTVDPASETRRGYHALLTVSLRP